MSDPLRIPTIHQPAPQQRVVVSYLPDATEEEAYRQGWFAFAFKFCTELCPYPPAARAYVWWMEGWNDARDENGGV